MRIHLIGREKRENSAVRPRTFFREGKIGGKKYTNAAKHGKGTEAAGKKHRRRTFTEPQRRGGEVASSCLDLSWGYNPPGVSLDDSSGERRGH